MNITIGFSYSNILEDKSIFKDISSNFDKINFKLKNIYIENNIPLIDVETIIDGNIIIVKIQILQSQFLNLNNNSFKINNSKNIGPRTKNPFIYLHLEN